MTDRADALHKILNDVHDILQQRLVEIGETDTPHVLMAIGPHGMALVRTNVDPEVLKAMSQDLGDAADGAMQRPPDNEPLN
ncbi:hypothetical protein [Reyranella sp.]|uniref:hypothetical protein n=1 Tax=Reyranella sp. TaxID=1929291 RepID=UPI0040361357